MKKISPLGATLALCLNFSSPFVMAAEPSGPPINVLMMAKVFGAMAPFYYGVEKGIFAAEGLNVVVKEGNGSYATAKSVANDPSIKFGFADSGAMLRAVKSENKPLVMLTVLNQKSPMGLMVLDESPHKTLRDLIGKRVIFGPTDGSRSLWPVVLKQNGLNRTQFTEVILSNDKKTNGLFNDTGDAVGVAYNAEFVAQINKVNMKKVRYLAYAEMGLNTLSYGMFASAQTIADKTMTCKMVRALRKAWDEAKKNPADAARITNLAQ